MLAQGETWKQVAITVVALKKMSARTRTRFEDHFRNITAAEGTNDHRLPTIQEVENFLEHEYVVSASDDHQEHEQPRPSKKKQAQAFVTAKVSGESSEENRDGPFRVSAATRRVTPLSIVQFFWPQRIGKHF
jgi:hypothetical protein